MSTKKAVTVLTTRLTVYGNLRARRLRAGSQELLGYGLGWLSLLTGLSLMTLRALERNKVLPRPILQMAHNVRVYTAPELVAYAQIFRDTARCKKGTRTSTRRQQLSRAHLGLQQQVSMYLRSGTPLPDNFLGLETSFVLPSNYLLPAASWTEMVGATENQ